MIGIIGTGNMGSALINGAIESFGANNVTFFDKDENKCSEIEKKYGIKRAENNNTLVNVSDMIVLAVKPQVFFDILAEIEPDVTGDKTILSIAPGIEIKKIKEALGEKGEIVRIMPNTPAQVGAGMSAICFMEGFKGKKEDVMRLFDSVGMSVELPESLMNAAVVANGSSPAFVFMFIEAMADGAVKYGIPRATAYKMVAQTVLGSAEYLLKTGLHPGVLKDAVCSPGGTTICGVSALEEAGFRSALIKGCDAVYEKTVSMN